MTKTTINLTTVSIQNARPSYSYGTRIPYPPIKTEQAVLLIQAALPTIPANAIVTVAEVRFNQAGSWSGENTVTVRRNAAAWTTKVTWSSRPSQTGAYNSTTKTNATPGITWAVNVAGDVQSMVNGSVKNYGWMLSIDTSGNTKVRGQASPDAKPYLYIEWEVPAVAPTGLSPDGAAVDVDKPILTMQHPSGTTAMQIQIDPAMNDTTPAWDSGEVPVDGTFDLSTSTYPGLASGTTYWRARSKTATGWGPYSAWADFSRVAAGVLTITSPTATPGDPTPPIHWSFTGTQTAWQARLLDNTGRVLSDSGIRGGTATAWTPTTSLGANGATGAVQVRVWDDQLRTATPGRPDYVQETLSVTVTLDGTVAPMSTFAATQDGIRPAVILSGTRTAGAPDEVIVFRRDSDGAEQQVARVAGADCFSGTNFTFTDWTASCAGPVFYRVAPVVNNAVASTGPQAAITPTCTGLWLVEDNPPEGGDAHALVAWDTDDLGFSGDDLATVHTPVGGSWVRRRVANLPPSGSASGLVASALDVDAADTLETLARFRTNDAGTVYRLVAGHLNIPVVAGDFATPPSPISTTDDVVSGLSFNWWGV